MEAPCSSGNVADQLSVTDWPQMMERLPSLSEIMSSFGLPESTQMASVICPQELSSHVENGAERNLRGKKRKKLPECGALRPHSPLARNQNVEAEQQKDVPIETAKSSREQKNGVGQVKEDYVHVRAKRGQATNSHSLAERVRREKISERMRLLQDLVPGCNKITGKALMLDEIINYVQSLQRQVEFLSMKLAAVNPELNLDIEQIFTKENLHLRFGTGSSPALGYCPQIAISRPRHISSMPQMSSPWNNEFQNAMRMGIIPNLPHDAMELNGSTKVEL